MISLPLQFDYFILSFQSRDSLQRLFGVPGVWAFARACVRSCVCAYVRERAGQIYRYYDG